MICTYTILCTVYICRGSAHACLSMCKSLPPTPPRTSQDILDTGNTLKYMLKQLAARDPASVKTAVLLHKVMCVIIFADLGFVASAFCTSCSSVTQPQLFHPPQSEGKALVGSFYQF